MNISPQDYGFSNFFSKLNVKLSKPQRNHLNSFVEGIISCDKRKNISNIWEHSLNSRDRSSFSKFILYSPWSKDEVNSKRINFAVEELNKASIDKPIFLSIDDTLSVKRAQSKSIEGLKYNHSHTSGKREWSHCQVSLHGFSNGLSLPLDFKTYLDEESCKQQNRNFKSKGDLALDMLKGFNFQQDQKSYLLMDSWYSSSDVINEAQRLGFQVISGLKSNRIFYPGGIRHKLNEFAKELKEKDLSVVTTNGRKHYVYRHEGHIKGIENAVILISWIDEFNEDKTPFYLICTDTSLSNKEIFEYYKNRWEIETSFRYQKDRLGLDQYEMRSLKGIERFWELIYLVYSYLELKRFVSKIKENLGKIIDKIRAMRTKELISYVFKMAKNGVELAELLKTLRVLA